MKKFNIILVLSVFTILNVNAQIKMSSNGNVSIGKTSTPQSDLDVAGTIRADNFVFRDGSSVGSGSGSSSSCLWTKSGSNIYRSSGNVGIGSSASSSYRLYVNGNTNIKAGSYSVKIGYYYSQPSVIPSYNNRGWLGSHMTYWSSSFITSMYCTSVFERSDKSVKENINDLGNSLDKIKKMRGVTYNLKTDDLKRTNQKSEIGFIAQEIKEIAPEVVHYNKETGLYSISYTRVIPILVEAIKEQQKQIDELVMKTSQPQINTAISEHGNAINASLKQNAPNPFTEVTTIKFYLDNNISNAILYVYNLQGKQIKSIQLYERGNGQTSINGYELDAGMYYYSLIADDVIVDTKQMIITN